MTCPRCRDVSLQPRAAHGVDALACERCHGLWLDYSNSILASALEGAAAAPGEALPCPSCRTAMRAWNVRGTVIDRCDVHGVWFDHAELDRIVARPHREDTRRSMKDDVAEDAVGWVVEAIGGIVDIFT